MRHRCVYLQNVEGWNSLLGHLLQDPHLYGHLHYLVNLNRIGQMAIKTDQLNDLSLAELEYPANHVQVPTIHHRCHSPRTPGVEFCERPSYVSTGGVESRL